MPILPSKDIWRGHAFSIHTDVGQASKTDCRVIRWPWCHQGDSCLCQRWCCHLGPEISRQFSWDKVCKEMISAFAKECEWRYGRSLASNVDSAPSFFPAYWETEESEVLLLGDFFVAPSTGSNWHRKAMKYGTWKNMNISMKFLCLIFSHSCETACNQEIRITACLCLCSTQPPCLCNSLCQGEHSNPEDEDGENRASGLLRSERVTRHTKHMLWKLWTWFEEWIF